MSPRTRVLAIVAVVAAIAAGAVVGVTVLQTRGESTGSAARKGVPPLYLPASKALTLYRRGRRSEAEALYARSHSLADEIGAAFSRWPHGTLDDMKRLAASHPGSALVALHLGLADYWSGRDGDAAASWRRAATAQPDTPYAVAALDFLNPGVVPGLPYIVVDVARVDRKARLPLARGILAWDRERPVSARRELDAAAALAPNDPAVLTAAAVATYSPAHPLRPFPTLGPLSGRFPNAAVVRLHLGLLLLWTKQVAKAERELRLAIGLQPGSAYARSAKQLLDGLAKDGTK